MRTAEHDGDRYLLVKSSSDSSLVRDPETGTERYVPNEELTLTGESPLVVAADAVPEAQRRLLTAVHSESVLGLLVELDDHGPLSVRDILDRYDLCESDLHGRRDSSRRPTSAASAATRRPTSRRPRSRRYVNAPAVAERSTDERFVVGSFRTAIRSSAAPTSSSS